MDMLWFLSSHCLFAHSNNPNPPLCSLQDYEASPSSYLFPSPWAVTCTSDSCPGSRLGERESLGLVAYDMELYLEQKIYLLVHGFNCVNYNCVFFKIVLGFLECVHKQKNEGLQSIIKKIFREWINRTSRYSFINGLVRKQEGIQWEANEKRKCYYLLFHYITKILKSASGIQELFLSQCILSLLCSSPPSFPPSYQYQINGDFFNLYEAYNSLSDFSF